MATHADDKKNINMGVHADELVPPPPAYGDPYDSETPAGPPTPGRRDSESSTERSAYDEKMLGAVASASTQQQGDHTLHFYGEGKLLRNLAICRKNSAGQSVSVYYAESSEYKPNKPDVLLHEGAEASGRVLAAAKFRWTRTLHLCLGDPNSTHQWEEMGTSSLLHHAKYELKINGGPNLAWERTMDSGDGVGASNKASLQNYRIVDTNSGKTVAVYVRNSLKSWKKHGKLVFHADIDPTLEKWVVIGSAALAEKTRRRNLSMAAAAGGSSGGN